MEKQDKVFILGHNGQGSIVLNAAWYKWGQELMKSLGRDPFFHRFIAFPLDFPADEKEQYISVLFGSELLDVEKIVASYKGQIFAEVFLRPRKSGGGVAEFTK